MARANNSVECPTCGNFTTTTFIDRIQKCQWCRRHFKITVLNKKNGKGTWTTEPVDFKDLPPRIETVNNHSDKDT